ncbi:type II/IV secretion system protein [Candidatus Poribacteria bacterium]|nr:type II/IV secretion system protein [Candidatus Poribacteria bacterium]
MRANKELLTIESKALELCENGLIYYQRRWLRRTSIELVDYLDIESVHSDSDGGASLVIQRNGATFKILGHSESEAEQLTAALRNRMIERWMKAAGERIHFEDIAKWVQKIAESAEVVAPKLADFLLAQAVLRNASDIHLEPNQAGLRVSYRIDGFFQNAAEIPEPISDQLISRIKVMSRLITYERNTPQEGRMTLDVVGSKRHFRVSIMPTITGEKVVIRAFDVLRDLLELEELGFSQEVLNQLKSLLSNSHGEILVTGPSGSGKTTTLYAALCEINRTRGDSVNIVTIEDPVEYNLGLFNQIQVNKGRDLTFAKALASVLRMDPNVIMVGEIRDPETAQITTQAALTGHLILSTVHSGTAAGVFTRLLDMGLEGYQVVSSITGALAQRLVRKNCEHCREVYSPDISMKVLEKLEARDELQGVALLRGGGCAACLYTGYHGRTAITELLVMNEGLKEAVLKKSSTQTIETEAKALGMRTLKADGLEKVKQGVTTVEELVRVL